MAKLGKSISTEVYTTDKYLHCRGGYANRFNLDRTAMHLTVCVLSLFARYKKTILRDTKCKVTKSFFSWKKERRNFFSLQKNR